MAEQSTEPQAQQSSSAQQQTPLRAERGAPKEFRTIRNEGGNMVFEPGNPNETEHVSLVLADNIPARTAEEVFRVYLDREMELHGLKQGAKEIRVLHNNGMQTVMTLKTVGKRRNGDVFLHCNLHGLITGVANIECEKGSVRLVYRHVGFEELGEVVEERLDISTGSTWATMLPPQGAEHAVDLRTMPWPAGCKVMVHHPFGELRGPPDFPKIVAFLGIAAIALGSMTN